MNPDEIVRGAKLAASALTKHISDNEIDELSGLLTRRELTDLKRRVETELTDVMRNVIRLKPDNFDRVINEGYVKSDFPGMATYLDVRLVMDALVSSPLFLRQFVVCKFQPFFFSHLQVEEPKPGYFVRIQMTLSKTYGEGHMHDWSVSNFRILDFDEGPSL